MVGRRVSTSGGVDRCRSDRDLPVAGAARGDPLMNTVAARRQPAGRRPSWSGKTSPPVIGRDLPPRPEPLPKFLDDRDAAKLMAAARAAPDPRDRLVVEVLARTGLRAGELCGLDADAVVLIGDGHWLRVPIGKLRNDRY